jgi:hypothetical protein
MTAAEGVFFSNAGVLTVTGGTGTLNTAFSAIQNVKIEPRFEISKAFGWGSIFRFGAAQYNFEVDVSIEWIKWDPTTSCWIGNYFLNTAGGGTVKNTNTPVSFSVVVSWTNTGGTMMKLEISDVVFKNMPIDAKMGEWVRVNLEGSGANIVISNS